MKMYEHLHVDISPQALEHIREAVIYFGQLGTLPPEVAIEVENFTNECRARVQHAAEGIPDPPENCTCKPPADDEWLD